MVSQPTLLPALKALLPERKKISWKVQNQNALRGKLPAGASQQHRQKLTCTRRQCWQPLSWSGRDGRKSLSSCWALTGLVGRGEEQPGAMLGGTVPTAAAAPALHPRLCPLGHPRHPVYAPPSVTLLGSPAAGH